MVFSPELSLAEVEDALGGEFTQLQPLNAGGQGVVFRALSATGESVALKVYFADQLEERNAREVLALRDIAGPTLVRLLDAGKVNLRGLECAYMATAFVEGAVLADVILHGPCRPEDVVAWGQDIASAVDALWSRRIVHRDIKPKNIVVATDGHATLIDLGVARHLTLEAITTTGTTWGTVGYMSPEQARAVRQLSCKSDVFSLGLVMQECLAGYHPTSRNQLVLANGGFPTLRVAPSTPPSLATAIDRMVCLAPFDRPTPQEVVAILAGMVDSNA